MGNDRFIELVSKQLTNEITPAEKAELKYLVDSDPSYKKQLEGMNLYWEHSDTEYTDDAIAFQKIQDKIKRLEAAGNTGDAEIIDFAAASKNRSLFRFWPAAAASLVLITAGALFFKGNFSQKKTGDVTAGWVQKSTLKGQKLVATLADGTKVTLNSQSSIRYPAAFDGDTREIMLSGEAYFDVFKDHQHPFIIHTNKMDVKVLGTTFNLRSYPQDTVIETTLITGAIEVTMKDRPSDRIILKPNEKLILKNNEAGNPKHLRRDTGKAASGNIAPQYTLTSLTHFSGKDSSVIETAWMKNRFIFDNNNFADLADKMEVWYGVDIQFKNEKAKQFVFSGVFDNDSITQALDALRDIEKFDYKAYGSVIYIY
ncbi:FecR family protein [Mucilaginibacter pedocola]|uniref:FecR family protein n=1 Tax=Mucilaginibacter pedocola TaxID=1792845 RepID=A0A1S9P7T3_9SPHI|nr:FecR family protein [Mucilaginibacter pedocola]OOQ57020.1 hypothetical protein BC343_15895 [Mucilaginibacter pedocola]